MRNTGAQEAVLSLTTEHRMVDTRPMARSVLVHGGWHGSWCFRWLSQELEDRGHEVAAPDLPCEEVGLTPLDYAREAGHSRTRSSSVIRSLDSQSRISTPALAFILPRFRRWSAAR